MGEAGVKTVRAVKRPAIRRPVPVRRAGVPRDHTATAIRVLQPALRVGPANDPLEREAEATAERVVSMPAPEVAAPPPTPPPRSPPTAGRDSGAQRASTEDQPSLDALEVEPAIPAEQEDVEVPPQEDVDAEALEPSDMAEVESGAPEEPSAGGGEAQPARADGPAVVGAEGGAAPADVASRVGQPGAGRPLPAPLRAFMEPRFGRDFSDVRLHDAPEDRRVAARIGARAFTHGRGIWFGPGETPDNRRLMAHELTHVVQQTRHRPARGAPPSAAHAPVPAARAPLDRAAVEPTIHRFSLAETAEGYARQVPGYTLMTVILGKTLLTGERVTRSAENLIGGFMGLLPGGNLLFERLQETRALQQAFEWVSTRLSELNLTWSRVTGLIEQVWDAFPTLSPLSTVKRIFGPLVSDIVTFARDIRDKVLEFIVRGALKLAGPFGERVWGVIEKARDTISLILEDPLQFGKNLFSAVLKGFGQFGSNILEQLKKGLLGWLFGALQGLDLELPDKLDLKGIMSIGFQVVGLTWERIRKILVKRLNPNGDRKVSFIETAVDVLRTLVSEGVLGVWQKLLGMIDGFMQTVIGGIRDFVITSLVKAGLGWLAGLSNPVGAVIKVALAIYDMVVVFIERFQQIIDVATSIFDSIGAIARGQTQQAADLVEQTIGRTVPVVISFIAGLLGISGISSKIRAIIKKLQKPVEKAISKFVGFLVKKAKKLLSKLLGKLNSKRKTSKRQFKLGENTHTVTAKKKGKKLDVYIASEDKPAETHQAEVDRELQAAKKKGDTSNCGQTFEAAFDGSVDKAQKSAAKVDPTSQNTSERKDAAQSDKDLEAVAKGTEQAGKCLSADPFIDESPKNSPLIRAREPRVARIGEQMVEGAVGTHKELKEVTTQQLAPESSRVISDFYEVDHIIEKQFAINILENLKFLKPKQKGGDRPTELFRKADRAQTTIAARQTGGANFGQIGSKKANYHRFDEKGSELPGMIVFHEVHANKPRPAVAASALVSDAADAEDPHAFLRERLTGQLADELNATTANYRADPELDRTIKDQVNGGIARLRSLNTKIYQLGRTGPVGSARERGAGPGEDTTAVAFTPRAGERGRPDFTQIEGVGGPYSGRTRGFGEFINYDHIVEKEHPNKAKGLTFGAVLGEEIEKPFINEDGYKAQKKKNWIDKKKRVDKLRTMSIFAPSQRILGYDTENGYSVAIYRVVHNVVSRQSSDQDSVDKVAAGLRDSADIKNAAKDFVDLGKIKFRNQARGLMSSEFKENFLNRVDEHAGWVRSEYQDELGRVGEANRGNEEAARAQMQRIIARVQLSLHAARSDTEGLF